MAFSKQSKPTEVSFWAVLENQQAKISVPDVKENEWVKLNPGILVFYRIKYTDDIYKQLLPTIKDKVIPFIDRVVILEDAFALVSQSFAMTTTYSNFHEHIVIIFEMYSQAKSGHISTTQVLNIAINMQEEEDWLLWINMTTYFQDILNILLDFTPLEKFYNFGQMLMKSVTKKIGFDVQPNESKIRGLSQKSCLLFF